MIKRFELKYDLINIVEHSKVKTGYMYIDAINQIEAEKDFLSIADVDSCRYYLKAIRER